MTYAFIQMKKQGDMITGFFVDTATGKAIPVNDTIMQNTDMALLAKGGFHVISGKEAESYIAAIIPRPKIDVGDIVEKPRHPENPSLAIEAYPGKDVFIEIIRDLRSMWQPPAIGDSVFVSEKYGAAGDYAIYMITGIDISSSGAFLKFIKRINGKHEQALDEALKLSNKVWYISWNDTWYMLTPSNLKE